MQPSLKILKAVGIVLAGLLALVVAAFFVVLISGGIQTAIARKAIRTIDAHAEIESFKGGFKGATLSGLSFKDPQGIGVQLESADIRIGLWRLLTKTEIIIPDLKVKGLELDLSQMKEVSTSEADTLSQNAEPPQSEAASPKADIPSASLSIPYFSIEKLDVDVRIIFTPEQQLHLTAKGGGFAPQATGKIDFDLQLKDATAEGPLSSLDLRGSLEVGQPSPNALTTLLRFKEGAGSEDSKPTLTLKADYDPAANALEGSWEFYLDPSRLAFYIGEDVALPSFSAVAKSDYRFSLVNEKGTLKTDLTVDATDVSDIIPKGTLKGLKLSSKLDIALTKRSLTLNILDTQIEDDSGSSILSLQNLKQFEFPFDRDPSDLSQFAGEVLRLQIQQLPLGWAAPFTPGIEITSEPLSADFTIVLEPPHFTLKPASPLSIQNLSLSQKGTPLLEAVSFSLRPSFSYDTSKQTASGTLEGINISSQDASLAEAVMSFTLHLSPQSGEPSFKVDTFQSAMYLAPIFRQPVLSNKTASLKSGELTVNGSFESAGDIQADVTIDLTNLRSAADGEAFIDTFNIHISAQQIGDGALTVKAPINLSGPRGASNIDVTAQYQPEGDLQTFNIKAQGRSLAVEDVMTLATVFMTPPSPEAADTAAADTDQEATDQLEAEASSLEPDVAPLWKGYQGQVDVAIEKVILPENYLIKALKTQIALDPEHLSIKTIQAQLDEALFQFTSDLAFRDNKPNTPYALDTEFILKGFDLGGYLRTTRPEVTPEIEAVIDIVASFNSEAPNIFCLHKTAKGDLSFKSRDGILRPPIGDLELVKTAEGTAKNIAALGTLFGAEIKHVDTFQQALDYLKEIPFGILVVTLQRDDDLNYNLQECFLQSPELYLSSEGRVLHKDTLSIMELPLKLKIQLGAKGNAAKVFEPILTPEKNEDDFIMAPSLAIGGTLASPDMKALIEALQKGLTEGITSPQEALKSIIQEGDDAKGIEERVKSLFDIFTQ